MSYLSSPDDSLAYMMAALSPDQRVQRDAAARAAALRGEAPPVFDQRPRWGMEDPYANGAVPPALQPPPDQTAAQPPGSAAGAPQQRAPALPLALGAQRPVGGSTAPAVTNSPLEGEYGKLDAREQAALDEQKRMLQVPDYTKAQEAYQKQAEGGGRQLMLALAAQRAGEGFQPLQAQFLKQSAAASAPQKMLGGTMTPEGFIEDPEYRQELALKRNDAELKQIAAAKASNISLQERNRLELREEQLKREMQQNALQSAAMIAAGHDQARIDSKAGGGAGKILPAKTIDNFTEAQNKVGTMTRLGQEFRPEFAGGVGGLKQAIGATVPMLDNPSSEWWRNYSKESELIERHGLFGSALTPSELASWRTADIRGGMPPEMIQKNLARRDQILRQHFSRAVQNYGNSKYDVSAFEDPTTGAPGGAGMPAAATPATPAAPAAPANVPTAVNPKTGQTLRLINGQWQ